MAIAPRRFQKRVYIPLPDLTSRVEILKLHAGDDCDLSEIDWKHLGRHKGSRYIPPRSRAFKSSIGNCGVSPC